MSWRSLLLYVLCALCHSAQSWSKPPALLRTTGYQAPVRGDPDDLLFIAGSGFHAADRVVYALADTPGTTGSHPAHVPDDSTAQQGTAEVVQVSDPPYSIAVRLPAVVQKGKVYRLWIVDPDGDWSEPLSINDPRPLWITPANAHSTADNTGLQRRIRVVGRNLAPPSAGSLWIRLRGPREYRIRAIAARPELSTLDKYIAEGQLPQSVTPGNYFVGISSDERTWVEVPGQQFQVDSDPGTLPRFELSDPDVGACTPDDGRDDGACLARAIDAARQRGGGVVIVPKGHWDLASSGALKDPTGSGFVLPPNVHLHGMGSGSSVIVRHGVADSRYPGALLTVSGSNSIEDLTFTDADRYSNPREARPVIQLGVPPPRGVSPDQLGGGDISNIVISNNVFRRVGRAVVDSGRPIARLFITGNDFGAYADGLLLIGGRAHVGRPFGISDSVIRGNRFIPGSYIDLTVRQGVIASQLGASHRVDFSSNIADGTRTEGLQDADDPGGWRAGFFWSENGDDEQLLVADNSISCPGDKAGDGEALAFDGNANTFAFNGTQLVRSAGGDSIAVRASLITAQNGHPIDAATYYVGHWVQVVDGPGLGQTRKIQGYTESDGVVTFRIAPKWDVMPVSGTTRIMVGRQYWQVYVLANRIEQRNPPCRKGNLSGPRGGLISLWAPSADSVIEANQQSDTDGIVIHAVYGAQTRSCPECGGGISFQTALEVRGNLIEGEYDWDSDCSSSGITESYGASPTPESPPPIVGFGVSISHNEISHADGVWGGAIDVAPTWFRGPPPQNWSLVQSSLIFHNVIRNITGALPRASCRYAQRARTGIRLDGNDSVRATVLYANRCEHVDVPVRDSGAGTTRLCAKDATDSCECRSR